MLNFTHTTLREDGFELACETLTKPDSQEGERSVESRGKPWLYQDGKFQWTLLCGCVVLTVWCSVAVQGSIYHSMEVGTLMFCLVYLHCVSWQSGSARNALKPHIECFSIYMLGWAPFQESARDVLETLRELAPMVHDITDRLAQKYASVLNADWTETHAGFYSLFIGVLGTISRLCVENHRAHAWIRQSQGKRLYCLFAPEEADKLYRQKGGFVDVQRRLRSLRQPSQCIPTRQRVFPVRPDCYTVGCFGTWSVTGDFGNTDEAILDQGLRCQ